MAELHQLVATRRGGPKIRKTKGKGAVGGGWVGGWVGGEPAADPQPTRMGKRPISGRQSSTLEGRRRRRHRRPIEAEKKTAVRVARLLFFFLMRRGSLLVAHPPASVRPTTTTTTTTPTTTRNWPKQKKNNQKKTNKKEQKESRAAPVGLDSIGTFALAAGDQPPSVDYARHSLVPYGRPISGLGRQFDWGLPSFTEFCLVLQVLPSLTEFYRVLLGFT